MADLLQSAASWLAGKLYAHLSQDVVYHRGPLQVSLKATIGRSKLAVSDELGGVRIERTDADFLVRAADLVLLGQVTEPARGDRIVRTTAGKTLTYEVLAPGGEPAWRYADPHRTMLRIHTKLLSVW